MMITIYKQETLFDTAHVTVGIFVKDAYNRATDCVADQFNCITDEFNLIFDDNTLVPNEEWYQKYGVSDSFYDTSTLGDETAAGYSTYASTFAGYETRNEHEEMQTTRQGERLKDESIQERDDDDDEKCDALLTKVGSKDVIDLSKDTIINDLSKAEGRIDQPIDVTKIEEKMRQEKSSGANC